MKFSNSLRLCRLQVTSKSVIKKRLLDKEPTKTPRSSYFFSQKQRRQKKARHLFSLRHQNIDSPLRKFWFADTCRQLDLEFETTQLLHIVLSKKLDELSQVIQKNTAESESKLLELNHDTVIVWLFYHWLVLTLVRRDIPIPKFYPENIKAIFHSHLDIRLYADFIRQSKQDRNKDNDNKKYNEKTLKRDFSKLLGEFVLKVALEDLQLSFLRVETLFTTINILIDQGNQLKVWNLCFIPNAVVPFHEENPFAEKNEWERALGIEKVFALIDEKLPEHFNDHNFIHSMLVISLMSNSYILHEKLLQSVIEQLNQPEALMRIGGQIAIYIPATPKRLSRTLFISPITEIYYRQYLKLSKHLRLPMTLTLDFPGQSFYQTLGKSADTLKLKTFKSWKHSILAYLNLEGALSGMMLDHVTHKQQSASLKPHVLQRVFKIENKIPVQENTSTGFSPMNFPEHKRFPRTLNWSKLRSYLSAVHIKDRHKAKDYQAIQSQLNTAKDEASTPMEALLIQYAIDCLSPDAKGHYRLAPRTILTHLDAFGLPLISATHSANLKDMPPLQRQAIYLFAFDQEGINKERFGYYLKIFEDWFMPRYQKEEGKIPDYEELFGEVKRPEFEVDANIICFDEYEQIKRALLEAFTKNATKNNLYFFQSAILLILGFKLDLRRGEAVGLHHKDYVFDLNEPTLFIKPHGDKKLKTVNAKRHFHLEEHLTPNEIALFKLYFDQLSVFFKNTPQNLFTQTPKKSNTKKIIDTLISTLHIATGDPTLKFHNFRHSKASWDMLSILNAQFDLKLEEQFFQHKPHTATFLKGAKERWQQAVHTPGSLHKAPYFLKKSMGHGSLTRTLKHYIHTLDFALAGIQKKKATTRLSIKHLVTLGIASKSSFYTKAKKAPLIDVALNIIHPIVFSRPEVEPSPPVTEVDVNTAVEKVMDYLAPQERLEQIKPYCLFQIYHELDDPEKIQERLQQSGLENVSVQEVTNLFIKTSAYRFKQITTLQGKKRLLDFYQALPSTWRSSIESGDFFKSDAFREDRALIEHFVKQLNIKVEDTADPLSSIKEYDLICHNYDEAKQVIQLIKQLKLAFSCKFMAPKKGKIIWYDWHQKLGLNKVELNESGILKAKVARPKGRLIIKIHSGQGKAVKRFEAYWFLVALSCCEVLHLDPK